MKKQKEKPIKLAMPFDEAMKRLAKIKLPKSPKKKTSN